MRRAPLGAFEEVAKRHFRYSALSQRARVAHCPGVLGQRAAPRRCCPSVEQLVCVLAEE